MDKVRPWCGQPSDRGRLKNRPEQMNVVADAGRADVEAGLDAATPAAHAEEYLSAGITSVGDVHGRVDGATPAAGDRLDALSAARHR